MSWFDASNIASIAKSALKEAQRTIDKALDIREENTNVVPANTPVDVNSDDFFQSWGIPENVTPSNKDTAVVTKSPLKSSKMTASVWGSFTGSFFDNSGENSGQRDLSESLEDSVNIGDFKESKLVVQHSDEGELLQRLYDDVDSKVLDNITKYEKPINANLNRLSVVSVESDKKSSESIEVLSNTDCTTSPDSDNLSSVGQALSVASSGFRQATDSVEVLFDSLTSPSSIELLDSDSSGSRWNSQHISEYGSPLMSPQTHLDTTQEKATPDSIEVIIEEQEENSVAEDTISYTSVSESTAATILDPAPISVQIHQKVLVGKNDMSTSYGSEKSVADVPITRPPSRMTLHLPLVPVSAISTQPQSSIKEDVPENLPSNIIDIPCDLDTSRSTLDESQSDKTVIASDLADSSTDMSDGNYNSENLKSMLADAMVERTCECDLQRMDDKMMHREISPLSSERSDMVKIGSDQASGHTSGDELETTTSSDIEIISSPNGDSSSTHSRHSPSKIGMRCKNIEPNVDALLGKLTFKKMKGHNRELSEASSISDESEIERLLRHITELTEILESRETKLIDVSRKNAELLELNDDLRNQLDTIYNKKMESLDLSQVTEEYTQRLSALERKFQQAIREKDSLRKQLNDYKEEAAQRVSRSEIDLIVSEKDEIIKELRDEGEKLSKQHLQHSNIIKKLRAKEKEHENTIKYLKENVEDFTAEVERMKRALMAKEEIERTQIEAVHQLTTKNKKMEGEVQNLKGSLEDYVHKYETVKKSFEVAKKELADKSKASSELLVREQLLLTLEKEKRTTELQNQEIISHLEDLRTKLQEAEDNYARKEQQMRLESNKLLQRLEDAETRNEELAQSVMEVSKPLVRQLESLQATYNLKVSNFEQIEHNMTVKINDLQTKLKTLVDLERVAREDCVAYKNKLSSMELELSEVKKDKDLALMQMDQKETEHIFAEQKLKSEIDILLTNLNTEKETVENLRKEVNLLQVSLQLERTYSTDDRQSITVQEPLDQNIEKHETVVPRTSHTRSASESLSSAQSESLSSSLWLPDDAFDTIPSRCTNMLEMQYIQTSLKQREGEVLQLNWELNRREHERTILNKEISTLSLKVESLASVVKEHECLRSQFAELQQKYDTLCQLYGEKVEETEELKLDLIDVKEMYKTQIDELLKQTRDHHSSKV